MNGTNESVLFLEWAGLGSDTVAPGYVRVHHDGERSALSQLSVKTLTSHEKNWYALTRMWCGDLQCMQATDSRPGRV